MNILDSGKRQEFVTGSVRDTNTEKGDFSLLQTRAITQVAKLLQAGAAKYKKSNWKRGQPLSRYMDSMFRHAFKFLEGQTDEAHDVACAWNILCMIETKQMIAEGLLPKELDDLFEVRTGYSKEEYEKLNQKDYVQNKIGHGNLNP